MPNRTDVINHLIQKHNLKRYLELGVQNTWQNFDKINCPYKVGVDPDPKANASFCMTSDEFFETGFPHLFVNHSWETKFDIILIDGLHTAEQVKKDFENALKILTPNGFIVLHDLLPETYERTIIPRPTKTGPWNGDCWKFGCKLGLLEDFYTVGVDNGCGVWRNSGGYYIPSPKEWIWEEFDRHKNELLNVITWNEFIALSS